MTTYTKYDLMAKTRDELIELALQLGQKVEVKTTGRKEQVLNCLRSGVVSIDQIAKELGINNKNVSSQLTYLRKDGYMIYSIRMNNMTTLKLEENK